MDDNIFALKQQSLYPTFLHKRIRCSDFMPHGTRLKSNGFIHPSNTSLCGHKQNKLMQIKTKTNHLQVEDATASPRMHQCRNTRALKQCMID